MLKKEIKDKLKADFGIDVDKLEAAIKADTEQDFELPADVTVMKTTDLAARDQVKIDEGKRTGEIEGEKKGKELAAKAFRKKFALPDEIGVDIDKVVEAVNSKVTAGDPALKEQVTKLLADNESLKLDVEKAQGTVKQTQQEVSLIGMFPAKRKEGLKDSERLLIMKNDLQFVEENGATVAKRNGNTVTHPTTHAPLPVNDVVIAYFTERGWVDAEGGGGGRGGGNQGGGGAGGVKKMSEFTEKWLAENPGKTEISPEFMTAVNDHAKGVPDFVWD